MATLFAPRRPEAAAAGLSGASPAVANANTRQARPATASAAVSPASKRPSSSSFARGREAASLLLFVSSVFVSLAIASFAHSPSDPSVEGPNWVGPVGASAASFLVGAIGFTAWTVPVELMLLTWPLLKNRSSIATLARLAGDFLVVLIVAALVQVAMPEATINGAMPAAGAVGELFGELMRSLFSTIGSFLLGLTAIALILINRASFSFITWAQRVASGTEIAATRAAGAGRTVAQAWERAADLRRQREQEAVRLGPVVHDDTPDQVIVAALAPESDASPAPPVLHVDGAAPAAAPVADAKKRPAARRRPAPDEPTPNSPDAIPPTPPTPLRIEPAAAPRPVVANQVARAPGAVAVPVVPSPAPSPEPAADEAPAAGRRGRRGKKDEPEAPAAAAPEIVVHAPEIVVHAPADRRASKAEAPAAETAPAEPRIHAPAEPRLTSPEPRITSVEPRIVTSPEPCLTSAEPVVTVVEPRITSPEPRVSTHGEPRVVPPAAEPRVLTVAPRPAAAEPVVAPVEPRAAAPVEPRVKVPSEPPPAPVETRAAAPRVSAPTERREVAPRAAVAPRVAAPVAPPADEDESTDEASEPPAPVRAEAPRPVARAARPQVSLPLESPPAPQAHEDESDEPAEVVVPAGATDEQREQARAQVEGPRVVHKENTPPRPAPPPPARRIVPMPVDFVSPGPELLDQPPATVPREDPEALKARAKELERVLANYGVKGTVVDIHTGPTVSTFELIPAEGTKVRQVAGLDDDLALGLSCKVRIVAPIPGKNRIGFELPNRERIPVNLRELIEERRFQELNVPLPTVLGRDIVGSPFYGDLSSMPHVIVAGATGAGKSVGLNVMLVSLLMRRTPEQLRLLMVDPKVVELAPFDRIPHLLLPVVTDMKQAANALKWAVDEMERRYQLFANAGTKNIGTYNAWVERAQRGEVKGFAPTKSSVAVMEDGTVVEASAEREVPPPPDKIPYIVIVVDEFADLIMQQGKDVEAAIARLAQKARAAGMHVILATQRPSTDVITGTIKSNFPSRVAFRVVQWQDSKTILDEKGAEQLLGKGDMLVKLNGATDTRRVQCPFVTEEEVQRVCDFLRAQGEPVYDESITRNRDEESEPEEEDAELDPRYDEAVKVVAETRKCSTSWLQRKLGLGYNRAAKIVEVMEKRGIVGPANGSKEREVLIGPL